MHLRSGAQQPEPVALVPCHRSLPLVEAGRVGDPPLRAVEIADEQSAVDQVELCHPVGLGQSDLGQPSLLRMGGERLLVALVGKAAAPDVAEQPTASVGGDPFEAGADRAQTTPRILDLITSDERLVDASRADRAP